MLKKNVLKIGLIATAVSLSFVAGRLSALQRPQVHYVDYEDYQHLISEEEDFILYIGRSSCKICAIVSGSIHKFAEHGEDIYVLNLEEYRGTDLYSSIKEDIGFNYVPCFKAYEHGKEIAHLNNPLDSAYFQDGADYATLIGEMETRVYSFIDGISGVGPLITETPTPQRMTATPQERKKED